MKNITAENWHRDKTFWDPSGNTELNLRGRSDGNLMVVEIFIVETCYTDLSKISKEIYLVGTHVKLFHEYSQPMFSFLSLWLFLRSKNNYIWIMVKYPPYLSPCTYIYNENSYELIGMIQTNVSGCSVLINLPFCK